MVKVALTSDNHFDINQVSVTEMIQQQGTWLMQQGVDIYLIAGDLFNHFDKSLAYAQHLQKFVPDVTVRFIAGNHDMVNGVTFDELEQPLDDTYLHNQYLDVAGTDWRIIGNNGWYDYSFADSLHRPEERFAQWKRAYWLDSAIPQPLSDPERMQLVLGQVRAQLSMAAEAQKKVLFMTHFVPRPEYLHITQDDRFWNMMIAMLGSRHLGDLLAEFHVKAALFGHMHIHPKPQLLAGTMYYDQAVGYGTKRRREWQTTSFFEEWRQRTRILTL